MRPHQAEQSSPSPTDLGEDFRENPVLLRPYCAPALCYMLSVTVPKATKVIPIFQMGEWKLGEVG